MSSLLRVLRILLVSLVLGAGPLSGSAAAPLPIETLAKHASFRNPVLSPSGRYLAVLVPLRNRSNLAVLDLDTMKANPVTSFDSLDVGHFVWLNDSRLVFNTVDLKAGSGAYDQFDSGSGGIYAVDRNGEYSRVLVPPPLVQRNQGFMSFEFGGIIGADGENSNNVLLQIAKNDEDSLHIFRVDTSTGRRTSLITDPPGRVSSIVRDTHLQIRAMLTHNKEQTRQTLWFRPSPETAWVKLEEFGIGSSRQLQPVGFSADDATLYVLGTHGTRDTEALFAYDTAKHQLGEQLVAHPRADIRSHDLLFSSDNHELLRISVDAGDTQQVWLSSRWDSLQRGLDKALPERQNTVIGGKLGGRVLIFSRASTDAGKYYLFDAKKGSLSEVLSPYPDIAEGSLVATRFFRYQARDGLSIPAYLTLPPDRPAKKLPLVVLVHGGPWARDTKHYDPEVQLLASRGYAVLQAQFRGSTGFGSTLYSKGFKQWGLAMQDDLDDGVDQLVREGTVDSSRVAIMGASYGGFAVLSALSRTPDRYRCGIDIVGVSDPALMFSISWSDAANSQWLKHRAKDMIGDPDRDADLFARISPLNNAKAIHAPVLMAYGQDDFRVPLPHGTKMRDALLSNGTQVRWLSFLGEGHGFLIPENRATLYREIERFLATNLAPR